MTAGRGTRVRVLIVDDHPVVCEGVRNVIEPEFEAVGIAHDAKHALELATALQPDVALVDISMPGGNGMELLHRMQAECPAVRVIMLTMHADRRYMDQARELGAMGYVLKLSAPDQLRSAIRRVNEGMSCFDEQVPQDTPAPAPGAPKLRKLTPRQIDVLFMTAQGLTAAETARKLGIGTKTVEFHRWAIRRLLELPNTAALVRYAQSHGIVDRDQY